MKINYSYIYLKKNVYISLFFCAIENVPKEPTSPLMSRDISRESVTFSNTSFKYYNSLYYNSSTNLFKL